MHPSRLVSSPLKLVTVRLLFLLTVTMVLAACAGPNAELAMEAERMQVELDVANEASQRQKEIIEDLRVQVTDLLAENRRLTQRVESAAVIGGGDCKLRIAMLEQELLSTLEQAQLCEEAATGSNDRLAAHEEPTAEQVIVVPAEVTQQELDAFLEKVKEEKEARIARAQNRYQREHSRSGDRPGKAGECCVYLFDPQLGHIDRDLFVTGTFENGREIDIAGDLIVEVFDGTELCYSDSANFTVPSRLQQDYEFSFRVPNAPRSGRFQARVRWEDSAY